MSVILRDPSEFQFTKLNLDCGEVRYIPTHELTNRGVMGNPTELTTRGTPAILEEIFVDDFLDTTGALDTMLDLGIEIIDDIGKECISNNLHRIHLYLGIYQVRYIIAKYTRDLIDNIQADFGVLCGVDPRQFHCFLEEDLPDNPCLALLLAWLTADIKYVMLYGTIPRELKSFALMLKEKLPDVVGLIRIADKKK